MNMNAFRRFLTPNVVILRTNIHGPLIREGEAPDEPTI
jgi:hypothetical protein